MKGLLKFLCIICFMMATVAPARAATLPAGYTELEYIQSTGTQWIDTGFTANGGMILDAKVLPINGKMAIGSITNTGILEDAGKTRNLITYVTNSYQPQKLDQATIFYSEAGTSPAVIHFDTTGTKFYTTINGNQVVNITTNGSLTNQATTVKISYSDYSAAARSGRYYYVKLSDSTGAPVRDFVPAKNASGVIGMYDTVNDVFYTNRGTGTFTAGPIACNGTKVNYTSATGTGVQNGTPTPTNPIDPVFYTQGNMVLRKVGDVADSYDSTTGKITRRIGVKVLDGTENWTAYTQAGKVSYRTTIGNAPTTVDPLKPVISTHFVYKQYAWTRDVDSISFDNIANSILYIRCLDYGTTQNVTGFKQYLADQYAAGTPVTVYYPLATAVEEDWAETSYCAAGIKIATTKYTEDAFAGLMTTLSEAITKVTNIVDTTVQQATEIGNLATTKQDRPDTDCPAGRKCLLIMGADNKPHWYLIQE